jgi:hypothetical protein
VNREAVAESPILNSFVFPKLSRGVEVDFRKRVEEGRAGAGPPSNWELTLLISFDAMCT